jgi:hypothetical protein
VGWMSGPVCALGVRSGAAGGFAGVAGAGDGDGLGDAGAGDGVGLGGGGGVGLAAGGEAPLASGVQALLNGRSSGRRTDGARSRSWMQLHSSTGLPTIRP